MVFAVTSGEVDASRDAGLVTEPDPSAQVGDRVWLDANANGVQNGGESGVVGVAVKLAQKVPDVYQPSLGR